MKGTSFAVSLQTSLLVDVMAFALSYQHSNSPYGGLLVRKFPFFLEIDTIFMLTLLVFVILQSGTLPDDLPKIVTPTPTPSIKNESEAFPVLLRIPEALIVKSVDRDFQHSAPVQQKVLGTSATGTTHCQGTVTCIIEEMVEGAAFSCRISGTVRSDTCGTNGPATIQSHAYTSYIANKRFFFDKHQFNSFPTTVVAHTQLTITGVGSTLPRLRGRIVQHVATQRAQQSRSQAESIAQALTERELCQQIDADFATRLSEMNQKLANRLSLLKYFPAVEHRVHVRSFTGGVEIGLGTAAENSANRVESRTPMGDSVELWFRPQIDLIPERPIPELLLSSAPTWLATFFSHNPTLLEPHDKKVFAEAHSGWLVFRLNE